MVNGYVNVNITMVGIKGSLEWLEDTFTYQNCLHPNFFQFLSPPAVPYAISLTLRSSFLKWGGDLFSFFGGGNGKAVLHEQIATHTFPNPIQQWHFRLSCFWDSFYKEVASILNQTTFTNSY